MHACSGQELACIVSRAVLDDHYGADGLDGAGRSRKLQDNRSEIEALIRQKYLHDPVEESATIILKTLDIERLRSQIAPKQSRPGAKRKSSRSPGRLKYGLTTRIRISRP
jgi:hypothetical protein